jgi:hypothetical protein
MRLIGGLLAGLVFCFGAVNSEARASQSKTEKVEASSQIVKEGFELSHDPSEQPGERYLKLTPSRKGSFSKVNILEREIEVEQELKAGIKNFAAKNGRFEEQYFATKSGEPAEAKFAAKHGKVEGETVVEEVSAKSNKYWKWQVS